MASSFFDQLSPDLRDRLLVGSSISHVGAGETIFLPSTAWRRTGVVLEGVARAYVAAPDVRQFTVRFVRAGGLIGRAYPLVKDQTPLGISAVTACSILELDARGFVRIVESDPAATLAALNVFSRRLEDVYATLAARAFGTVRDRVVDHLLSLGRRDAAGRITVAMSQQRLADSVGSVREVVARILRELRDVGLVATRPGTIEILDPEGLAALLAHRASTLPD
jgi:CRP/FNR family transcriptional regulator